MLVVADEEIATLDDVELGMLGARRITSLALGSDGEPRVAFSDRSSLFYAVHDADGWAVEEVVSAASLPLGQLVSLKVDAANAPHIALWGAKMSSVSGAVDA